MKTLIVVDMQNDFIDGALGTKEAQAIVKNVAKKDQGVPGRGKRDNLYQRYSWGRLS